MELSEAIQRVRDHMELDAVAEKNWRVAEALETPWRLLTGPSLWTRSWPQPRSITPSPSRPSPTSRGARMPWSTSRSSWIDSVPATDVPAGRPRVAACDGERAGAGDGCR